MFPSYLCIYELTIMVIKRNRHLHIPGHYFYVLSFCLLWLVSCRTAASHDGSQITDLVSLTDALRREGMTVMPVGPVSHPFLSITGTESEINGEAIQIFEYMDITSLEKEIATIQRDGSMPGTIVSWASVPHFFRVSTILVIYDGDNEAVLTTLEDILGKPFIEGQSAKGQ